MIVNTGHPESQRQAVPASGHGPRTPASRFTSSRPPPSAFGTSSAFTLIELLMVIAIMGIIAAIALPSIRSLKPNAKVAATRQLLDAVTRARQLALSQRTAVYMVFVPPNFWTDPQHGASWTPADWTAATNLLDKQLIGYAYVSLRSVGDQPGMHTPRYLSLANVAARLLHLPSQKFWPGLTLTNTTLGPHDLPTDRRLPVHGSTTNNIPFPLETTLPASGPFVTLPYIAFDGTGQLISGQLDSGLPQPELIPIAEGSVSYARNPNTKVPLPQPARRPRCRRTIPSRITAWSILTPSPGAPMSSGGRPMRTECGMQNAECGMQNLRSAECGVRNLGSAECGARNLGSAECGVRNAESDSSRHAPRALRPPPSALSGTPTPIDSHWSSDRTLSHRIRLHSSFASALRTPRLHGPSP